jgi:hypothetical protein
MKKELLTLIVAISIGMVSCKKSHEETPVEFSYPAVAEVSDPSVLFTTAAGVKGRFWISSCHRSQFTRCFLYANG